MSHVLPPLNGPQMPPATRVYVLLLLLITAVDVSVGKVIDSSSTFALDWGKTIKVRRAAMPKNSIQTD